jgi:RecJ-like exonuclease
MRVFGAFLFAILSLGFAATASAAERPTVPSSQAAAQVGKVATIRGRVIEIRRVADGPIIFEIDGKSAAPAFRALVYPMAVRRFGSEPETIYLGRIVEVTGVVTIRKDLPQTWLNDPTSIRLAGGKTNPPKAAAP